MALQMKAAWLIDKSILTNKDDWIQMLNKIACYLIIKLWLLTNTAL